MPDVVHAFRRRLRVLRGELDSEERKKVEMMKKAALIVTTTLLTVACGQNYTPSSPSQVPQSGSSALSGAASDMSATPGTPLGAQARGHIGFGFNGTVSGFPTGKVFLTGGGAYETDSGFVHAGAVGAGHFAKMVHNGIEYGLMQAYAEGWELLETVDMVDNVTEVFRSWREGTVIRSWLLDLLVAALDEDDALAGIRGYADDSGEGRWTIEAAIDNAVPLPAITAALFARFVSRQDDSPAMKAVAAMRNQFGGHAVRTEAPPGGDQNPA